MITIDTILETEACSKLYNICVWHWCISTWSLFSCFCESTQLRIIKNNDVTAQMDTEIL